jgi:hypothetical protein
MAMRLRMLSSVVWYRQRNHRAFSLGRWVIRPSKDKQAKRGGAVCNHDEVYLEQVSAVVDRTVVVTLPFPYYTAVRSSVP